MSISFNSIKGYNIFRTFNQYLNYNVILNLKIQNDIDYVKRSYIIPKTNYVKHTCYQPTYHMVKGYIDDETSNMISAGNILGAIRKLGGDETSNIYELIKGRLEDDLAHIRVRYESNIRRNNQYHFVFLN